MTSPSPARQRDEWRWNLWIVWLACLLGSAGISLANPFVPVFMANELGVLDRSALARWTGVIVAANGLTIIFASPIWGSVADRYGRRPMLLRALGGSGLLVAVLAAANSPWQLAVARLALGGVTGFMPIGSAVVTAEAPRTQVGWALGVLASAFAIGGAIGPLIGAAAAPVIGLRAAFVFAGALIGAGGAIVAIGLRERRQVVGKERPRGLLELRAVDGQTLRAIALLMTAQCFLWMFMQSAQPMLALRIIELAPMAAAPMAGLVFGVWGAAAMVGSLLHARLAHAIGYRAVTFGAVGLAATATLAAAMTSSVAVVAMFAAGIGLATGILMPTLMSTLGLQTPARLVGTVFGLSNSAAAVGFTIGPLATGLLAAAYSTSLGLASTVLALAIMASVLTLIPGPTAAPRAGALGKS